MAPVDPERGSHDDPQDTPAERTAPGPGSSTEDPKSTVPADDELGGTRDLWSDVTPADAREVAGPAERAWTTAPLPSVPSVARPGPRPRWGAPEPPAAPARHYPKMWALVDDHEAARAAAGAPSPPPVPGTFFPSATRPQGRPPPLADLDDMLSAMAEGLLVGETAEGHAEVRVTLRDEFFAGTELRLVWADEGLWAVLAPPDRETYWLLSGSQRELAARLTDRGLSLKGVEVREP